MKKSFDPYRLRLAADRGFEIGKHQIDSGQMCVMEAVSWAAGEEWSDMPACVAPSFSLLLQGLNDWSGDDALESERKLGLTPEGKLFTHAMLASHAAAVIGTCENEIYAGRDHDVFYEGVAYILRNTPLPFEVREWSDRADMIEVCREVDGEYTRQSPAGILLSSGFGTRLHLVASEARKGKLSLSNVTRLLYAGCFLPMSLIDRNRYLHGGLLALGCTYDERFPHE